MFVIYVTIDSFVVVVCHLYCCYNFLDRCKWHDCDGTMIDDGYGFDDGMGGDESSNQYEKGCTGGGKRKEKLIR